MIRTLKPQAIVYSEGEFGNVDGKVANGLIRYSEKYEIVAVIDSKKAGLDSGRLLDNKANGIFVFNSIDDALNKLQYTPTYFIYGLAPLAAYIDQSQREVIILAMKRGMNIINGLAEFFTEDTELVEFAMNYEVEIHDIRKPPLRKDLHQFTGMIRKITTPIITVMGTDCAVGKRTTALQLVQALKKEGLNAIFIATGQTGLLQGSKYGVAVDVLTSGFSTGEIESAILESEKESPDIIVVEGQGALSHPAFTSSSAIIRGAMPKAIILQHPPKRKKRCDFPQIPMPSLESEIQLIEVFSGVKVIAITLNHEGMNTKEVTQTIDLYEEKYKLPVTDVLLYDCNKLVQKLYEIFPELINIKPLLWQTQD
jgi:uncharacterized NAD-dependent epimerase/dehydratase family protein